MIVFPDHCRLKEGAMIEPQATERLIRDLGILANDLRFVFRVPVKPTAPPIVTLQSQYMIALVSVAKFLRRCGVGDDIARKFVELADAIGGLRNGVVTDPVRPAIAGGRGPDLHTIWALRADVCIALECFVRAGQGRDDAAGEIAERYPVFERLKRNARSSLKSSILSWRKHINKADVPDGDQILAHEREFLEARHSLPGEEIRAVGEDLLRQAAQITAKTAV
jgi:hypothetical protein